MLELRWIYVRDVNIDRDLHRLIYIPVPCLNLFIMFKTLDDNNAQLVSIIISSFSISTLIKNKFDFLSC